MSVNLGSVFPSQQDIQARVLISYHSNIQYNLGSFPRTDSERNTSFEISSVGPYLSQGPVWWIEGQTQNGLGRNFICTHTYVCVCVWERERDIVADGYIRERERLLLMGTSCNCDPIQWSYKVNYRCYRKWEINARGPWGHIYLHICKVHRWVPCLSCFFLHFNAKYKCTACTSIPFCHNE